ncbi:hypothetical protein [Xenophilus sp. Marseille-Q4582]|uniref:hypothetical protein n=1 Tax=Xenophilus sp. Marseille-Q4582 TaxID=2866600 RepID=UPI001CE45617|nr:hypothetical protein [Xenophilus sp. Marseille-Q4582]
MDLHVTRYLLGESPTDRETTCPAQLLYLDWLAQQAVQRGSARAMAAPVKSAYTDPSHALDLIERFKKHHQPHRSPRKP